MILYDRGTNLTRNVILKIERTERGRGGGEREWDDKILHKRIFWILIAQPLFPLDYLARSWIKFL